MAFHLKLIQPKELPQDGVTSAEFKPWTNHLTNFLQQDVENFRFLKGGRYSKWIAVDDTNDDKRITELVVADEEVAEIEASAHAVAIKNSKKARLLNTRNAQLSKLLQHVQSFVHYTESTDIHLHSTSIEWIFSYLRRHYNIEAKGSNLLKLTDHVYKSGMNYQTFYKGFRTDWHNNLRKEGEVLTHKGGKIMTADEILSPTFEDAIVLWCLEKIDPRLPKKVRKDYEHRLTGNTYLIDLQLTIFQSIDSMLEDLDKQAEISALTVPKDTSLSAISSFGGRGGGYRGGRGGRGGGQGRGKGGTYSRSFCRVCHAAGKPRHVYQNHNIGACSFFDGKDRKDMFAALKAMNVAEEENDNDDTWELEEKDLETGDHEG